VVTQEREQIRMAWDRLAAGYDEFVTETANRVVAEDALRRADLRPGMRLLDVASGSGALSIPAARTGADVLAVDISPAMIARLKARARQEGLANLEARVMDGHALELANNYFDISASQFGVMLFPDLPRGLDEMVRVTRPGGRVLIVTFGAPTQVEFLTFFLGAIQSVVPDSTGLPTNPPPLPFQVADPEVLRRRMAAAGLEEVRVDSGTHSIAVQSGRELWDWVVHSHPIGAGLVAGLTEEQGAGVRQVLDRKLRERAGDNGYAVLNSPVNIGIGMTPSTPILAEVATSANAYNTKESEMSDKNKAVIRRFLDELWNRSNFAVVDELLARDYDGHSSTVFRGPEGAVAFIPQARAAFPDFRFVVLDQIAEGDKVATRWKVAGTHEGPYRGVLPSGRRVEMTGITIFRLAGGKLVDGWTNEDQLGLLEQIGAVPAPVQA
jgi:ubiquinone/menaquinone biosynthesis C-methylase UbiE/predicted ester cyclase